jgi:hypothetical protein
VAKIADQWLSAHDALELLASCLERTQASRQIKEWASLGLILSQAEMLWEQRPWQGEVLTSPAEIPPHFWRAYGRKPMKEDWSLGSFESWACEDSFSRTGIRNPSEVHYRALNVEFECSDMLTLLPPHLRPKRVGRPEGYDWASASAEVLQQFEKSGGKPERKSQVEAALRRVLAAQDHHPAKQTIQRHALPIWERLTKADN